MTRRRGTAIVDIPGKGILLASDKHRTFMLPGGGAGKGESRRRAAIRELEEETDLETVSCEFLFEVNTSVNHKVFLIKPKGYERPKNEIKYLVWWNQGDKIKMSNGTKKILNFYLLNKNKIT
ncbi:MAG: NUDIX domain-containing protein [Candidatus Diapherotrites archaeon]|nr:NUDIX domain-containing protein [Candidatus Diapherotrites archaeon]MDZ4256972.1 NUDIX domain-containing protein [archaeon]